jgi:hypothetical protein
MGGLRRHWHVSLFAAARQCGPQSEVKRTCRDIVEPTRMTHMRH